MKTLKLTMISAPALLLAGMLAIQPAMAEKPSWAGGGKGDKGDKHDRSDRNDNHKEKGDRHGESKREHFEDRHRGVVRNYYDDDFRHGRCPPGLAKKHNGCMPPGQAKKWHVGQHLPRDVVYYSVPQALILQIGQPPSGYRYVRVASDILLMAIGTRMIVDAIQNLGRG